MENGENAVAPEERQSMDCVEQVTVGEDVPTPTKTAQSSATDDDNHLQLMDNVERKYRVVKS